MRYNFFLLSVLIFGLLTGCNKFNKTSSSPIDSTRENTTLKDELWKQFMKVNEASMQKMPPDSNCFVILNHTKVYYYKGNKLEFSDQLVEFLKNDSLIVYRVNNQPGIQIGYNRKDSVVLLTRGHPEGGNPTGDMEYFAIKVEKETPFHKN